MPQFYSNGKLLLTGEYLVLDGALALAIPTKLGQSLSVQPASEKGLFWKSLDMHGNCWFQEEFSLRKECTLSTPSDVSKTLQKILREAQKLNPDFLTSQGALQVTTRLDFPRDWGLGSSSTLINNIAQWAEVDAFQLLKNSFGGSGYDIAAAQNDQPIFYQINHSNLLVEKIPLSWDFTEQIYFIHLNKKQSSKKAIETYRTKTIAPKTIEEISLLSRKIANASGLSNFESLLQQHENILSETLETPTIKEQLFSDYPKAIKSLGAWGGDFILATGQPKDMAYFRSKGYHTVIPFAEMIK